MNTISHISGTILLEAKGSFLNGAGLGDGEDRNQTVPKTFRDGPYRVPYVSAQAWRRWLRNTLIEETGWPQSVIKAIDLSTKGTPNKIAGETNPIEFPEDDIFGYMKAQKGQGKFAGDEEDNEGGESPKTTKKVKSLMRASPFSSSILVSIRNNGWQGSDEGFVHLQEGPPLPYKTDFYNTHLQGLFCLNYQRLGLFTNLGDRVELDDVLVSKMLQEKKISLKEERKEGKIYEITNYAKIQKERTTGLLKALTVLRGGAKQAQFGTDVSPKVIIVAGLSSGNPIFNNLFEDSNGKPILNISRLVEIKKDYASKIVTPIFVGIRTGYLENEDQIRQINDKSVVVTTPIEAVTKLCELL